MVALESHRRAAARTCVDRRPGAGGRPTQGRYDGPRALTAKADEIEDAVYDLKAINPHKRPVTDKRTPKELMDIIEAKGQEITNGLAALRAARNAVGYS